jgi:cytidyltransferase-like protein
LASSSLQRLATDKVVYVDGGFDLFHVGHTEFLRVAREQGTYLIVGIHTDQDINLHKVDNNIFLCHRVSFSRR